jgi:hypothetical protein
MSAVPGNVVTQDLFNPLRYWTDTPRFIAQIDPQDAESDREDSLSDRHAFKLGEDLGRFRLEQRSDFPTADMARGFEHGLSQPHRASDHYIRKLMSLKVSAFTRGIPVSGALTSNYLRALHVPVCPVSGVVLTQGTTEGTDWSIDRLDNTLGYVPGNLCAISTRVNKLKNDSEFSSLVEQAQGRLMIDGEEGIFRPLDSGLLVIEALRLTALVAGPSAMAKGKLARNAPFAMGPTAWSTFEGVAAGIHLQCARTLVEGQAYTKRLNLFKRLGPSKWRASNRLVQLSKDAINQGVHPCDIWFDGRALLLLQELLDGLFEDPPTFDGVNPSALAVELRASIKPLGKYAR